MPAKSKAQQKMFGIAHAIQQGKMPASKARGPATDVAKAAKPKDVKDFASTKTKNLPQKVKKEGKDATLSFGDKPTSREKWPVEKWNTRKKKVKTEQVQKIREYVTKVVREVLAEANSGKSDEPRISQGKDGDWWVSGAGGYQDGPFATRGKAHGAMVDYKRTGNPSPRSAHSMDEAYNRGTAVISINGRNGHVRWRTSDGQYDEDLPVDRGGKRDKGYVKRRVAQIKKKLWGYTIKINDPDGMLKEATTELRYVDGNSKKWYSRIKGPEAMVKKGIERIEAKLKSQGRRSSVGSISRRTIDPKSSKNDGKWTKVTGRTLTEAGEKGKTWYLNWFDKKKKKWFEKEFKSEREASKEFDKIRDQHPGISYGNDNSIYG